MDRETLWANLMNKTIPTIPEIGYRFREHISNRLVDSLCLIMGNITPAEAMKKAKPNSALKKLLTRNRCITPSKREFILQDNEYHHLKWIPIMSVPMPYDTLHDSAMMVDHPSQ